MNNEIEILYMSRILMLIYSSHKPKHISLAIVQWQLLRVIVATIWTFVCDSRSGITFIITQQLVQYYYLLHRPCSSKDTKPKLDVLPC